VIPALAVLSGLGLIVSMPHALTATDPDVAPWRRPATGFEVHLAPDGEPGGKFVMEGVLWSRDDRTPLAGALLFAYHADHSGWYARPGARNAYPRLAGTLRTDARGRFRLVSVLPGMYDGPSHVHFELREGEKVLQAWAINLHMGPDEKPDSLWGRMAKHSDHWYFSSGGQPTYVTRDRAGVFHANCNLHWNLSRLPVNPVDSLRRWVEPHQP
jgi:hypothetical protein